MNDEAEFWHTMADYWKDSTFWWRRMFWCVALQLTVLMIVTFFILIEKEAP